MRDAELELNNETLKVMKTNLLTIYSLMNAFIIDKSDRDNLQKCYREVHSFKANCKSIDLSYMAGAVQIFEELILLLVDNPINYNLQIHDTGLKFCKKMDETINSLMIKFKNESTFKELEKQITNLINYTIIQDSELHESHSIYKILVAEDDKDIQEIIRISFEELSLKGIKIDFAMNGLEAFLKLYKNPYDLFITDFNMPKMDGESLLELWRLKITPNHCPNILMITGDSEAINSITMNDDGLYTLIKPFNIERINKLLKLILGSVKLNKE